MTNAFWVSRWSVFLGCFLFFFLNTPSAFAATPKLKAAGKAIASGASSSKKSMVIAAFQVLGVQSKVTRILRLIRSAYLQRTGQSVYSIVEVDNLLGQYGVSKLGNCSGKLQCLVKNSSKVEARQALYVNAGGFGGQLIFEFVHIDLTSGKQLHRFNRNFASLEALKKGLPAMMVKLFPDFGQLAFNGTPKGAQVYINERLRGSLPMKGIAVSTKKPLQIKVTHPGYKSFEKTLPVQANDTRLVEVKLTPIVVIKPVTPVFKTWWFWTLVGAGAVAVGTGVTVGVLNNQSSSKPQIRLPL